jgi:hypothetical protein
LESKSIVPVFIASVSFWIRSIDEIRIVLLFAGCMSEQLMSGVCTSLGGLDLIRQRADISFGSIQSID